MRTYFADTNFYLRFILNDNKIQADKVEHFLAQAKNEKIRIIYISAVIVEMEVILRRVYKMPKSRISEQLLILIKTPYLTIEDRYIWVRAFERFYSLNMALLDIFLFEKAQANGAEILSFDQKLAKLK